jgi:hypothetical protein
VAHFGYVKGRVKKTMALLVPTTPPDGMDGMTVLVPRTPPGKMNGVALKMTTSTLICPETLAKNEQNNILSNSVGQEEDSILKAYTDMKEAMLWWDGEDKHLIEDTHVEGVMKNVGICVSGARMPQQRDSATDRSR